MRIDSFNKQINCSGTIILCWCNSGTGYFFLFFGGNRSRLWLLLNFWFRSGGSTFNRRYLHMWLYKSVCQQANSLYLKVIRALFAVQSAFGNCIRFFSAIVYRNPNFNNKRVMKLDLVFL